jgi:LEA14-like dessication related protein
MKRLFRAVLLAIPFLALLPAGCKKPEAPLFQGLDNLQVMNPGWKESVISADVKYYNPNNYKLEFRRGELSVFINNHFVGKSVLDSLIEIPKKDSFLIPIAMKVNMRDILSNALEVLMLNEVNIKLDGFVRLGRAGVFIKVPIHYEGKQKIEVSVN